MIRPARQLAGTGLVALALAFAPGCGSTPTAKAPPGTGKTPSGPSTGGAAVSATPGATTTGTASYYADSLAGRPTASGEPYDPDELTAAHRTLPFGTIVEVAREDGRSVLVRINDRGPFGKKKRVIDLSRAAARELGLERAGIATITLRVVSVPLAR